jgi:hypothetical protein
MYTIIDMYAREIFFMRMHPGKNLTWSLPDVYERCEALLADVRLSAGGSRRITRRKSPSPCLPRDAPWASGHSSAVSSSQRVIPPSPISRRYGSMRRKPYWKDRIRPLKKRPITWDMKISVPSGRSFSDTRASVRRSISGSFNSEIRYNRQDRKRGRQLTEALLRFPYIGLVSEELWRSSLQSHRFWIRSRKKPTTSGAAQSIGPIMICSILPSLFMIKLSGTPIVP